MDIKRIGISVSSGIICAAMAASAAQAADPATKPRPATRPTIMLLADSAEQHGTLLATTRPAYSGSAYATGFGDDNARLAWHAKAPQGGIYQVEIRYSAPAVKGFGLTVNGISCEQSFQPSGDAWATHAGGKIELRAGDNTIELNRGWGFYDIDRVELIPTALTDLKKPPAALVDKDATPAAKALMQKLVDDYGRKTRSGVVSPEDAQLVHTRAGVWPNIMGGDLMDYSPSRLPFQPRSASPPERLIADAKAGYQLTVMWHWNAPDKLVNAHIQKDGKDVDASWYRGFYTEASDFDLAETMQHPDGPEYKLILRDIDAIAEQLKKFDDAGLPILWRPLHEADGKWFWWGAKGPDAFKALWALLHDRLTHVHHLHNLIWVYTGTTNWDWYPPADQFDIIGVDLYPKDVRDPASGLWDALQARWGDRKLLALTEMGGVPDVDAMAKLGIRWSYFASWSGNLGPAKMSPDALKRIYTSPVTENRVAK